MLEMMVRVQDSKRGPLKDGSEGSRAVRLNMQWNIFANSPSLSLTIPLLRDKTNSDDRQWQ